MGFGLATTAGVVACVDVEACEVAAGTGGLAMTTGGAVGPGAWTAPFPFLPFLPSPGADCAGAGAGSAAAFSFFLSFLLGPAGAAGGALPCLPVSR